MEVSVIVPVYNKGELVEGCLRSVLEQDLEDFEVVVVDDGSTDGSGELCDCLAKEYSHLRVIHVENGGVTRARRIAYEASGGRYITFVDSDDRMLPGGLRTLYEAIIRVDADELVATYDNNLGEHCDSGFRGWVDPNEMLWQLCGSRAKFCILWAVMFRREVLVDCLDEARTIIRPGQDILMQMMCLAKRPRVFFIAESVYYYMVGQTTYKPPRIEAQQAFDELLRKAFAPRWVELKDYYTFRQLNAYETFLSYRQFDAKARYYHCLKGRLNSRIPIADRIVYYLPTFIAYWLIKLRKSI